MRILVRRSGALGDVVLATPIIRRLRRENPEAHITVHTACPDVFLDNPYINAMNVNGVWDRFIDLDLAYERRPHYHIVDAYMLEAFGDQGDATDKQQCMFTHDARRPELDGPYVVLHAPMLGWRSRVLPMAFWDAVAAGLRQAGLTPVFVGRRPDYADGAIGSLDFRDQLPLGSLRTLMQGAVCFAGMDSGLLHIAGTTEVPIVGVFTCARPEFRLPYRGGVLGYACEAVTPDLSCLGCLHDRPPPVTTLACPRGDTACTGSAAPRPEQVIEAVLRMAKGV